jgi:hypothetical protein
MAHMGKACESFQYHRILCSETLGRLRSPGALPRRFDSASERFGELDPGTRRFRRDLGPLDEVISTSFLTISWGNYNPVTSL